jgi:hypothetical protein
MSFIKTELDFFIADFGGVRTFKIWIYHFE